MNTNCHSIVSRLIAVLYLFLICGLATTGPIALAQDEAAAKDAAEEISLTKRVAEFWQWFEGRSDHFHQTITDGKAPSLAAEVSEKIDKLLPGFAWVFGPGEEEGQHSFTLSAEGSEVGQLVTRYWMEQSPEIDNWVFYDAKQAGGVDGVVIELGDKTFDAKDVLISTAVADDRESVDIKVYHPDFKVLNEEERLGLIFIWLDQSLGEKGTARAIGLIDPLLKKPEKAKPLLELRNYVIKLWEEKKWAMTELAGHDYETKPFDGKYRSDVYYGTTQCLVPIEDFIAHKGVAKNDQLAGVGSHFTYLAIDLKNAPAEAKTEDELFEYIATIHNPLQKALNQDKTGIVIGAALGKKRLYIDFFLFDRDQALSRVKEIIDSKDLEHPVSMQPFYTTFGEPIKL